MNPFNNNVFRQMVVRSIRADYLENITGLAWLILQPLMLLAVYAFVFTYIFDARIGTTQDIGFVPYLAVAFWPWTAFAESVLKSAVSITQNAALIGKVAFPAEMLPLSTVTATFLMHSIGYGVVLCILQLSGTDIHWPGLLLALPVLLLLFVFACALSLVVSSLQVFIRDVSQILPPVMTFWFFTTPILYSQSFLPETFARLMQFNPMSWYVEKLRSLLLFGDYGLQWLDLLLLAVPIVFFVLAMAFFRRFNAHLEDFL